MAGLCTVCLHTRRGEVDALLIRGRYYRKLERRFGLARSSLSRHKRDDLRAELAEAESQRVEDIHARFRDLEGHARRLLKKAEQARDYDAAISALREVARLIALAEPPPPPPDPSAQRVSLTFTAAGPSTRVLPAAEKIIDVEPVGDAPPAKEPPASPSKQKPPPKREAAVGHRGPFWDDPTERDAAEDAGAAMPDPLKGY